MIKPVRYNMTIDIGRDWLETFEFCEDDGITPLDLTGKTYKMQIREGASHTSALIAEATVQVDTEAGRVHTSLSDAQTGAVTQARGYYDLMETDDASGFDQTVFYGEVTFQGRPTENA